MSVKKKPVKKKKPITVKKKATPKKTVEKAKSKEEIKNEIAVKEYKTGESTGGQWWKRRSKHGRDALFDDPLKLWSAAIEYFDWCGKNPLVQTDWIGKDATKVNRAYMRAYTIEGFSVYCDTHSRYIQEFEDAQDNVVKNKEATEEQKIKAKNFTSVIYMIREVIRTQKFEGAAAGLLNATIISQDLGLKNRAEMSGPDGSPIKMEVQQITGMIVK